MDPFTMMAIGGSALSAFGQIQSGRAAAGQALQSAELELINRDLMAVQAKQSAKARLDQYEIETATNKSMFSALGRLDDPSMKAFFDAQDRIIGEDLKRISAQTNIEMTNVSIKAAGLRAKSKNVMKSATVGAMGTLLQGMNSWNQARPATTKITPSTPPPMRGNQYRQSLLKRIFDTRG